MLLGPFLTTLPHIITIHRNGDKHCGNNLCPVSLVIVLINQFETFCIVFAFTDLHFQLYLILITFIMHEIYQRLSIEFGSVGLFFKQEKMHICKFTRRNKHSFEKKKYKQLCSMDQSPHGQTLI